MKVVVVFVSFCVLATSASYGPVGLETLDPMTLSWNEVHWLVKDQIKEVAEIKKEHDDIYKELTGCYGLEKCLSVFGLLESGPGSKLHSLGLDKGQISQAMERQKEEVENIQDRLAAEMRERERQQLYQQRQQVSSQSSGGGGRSSSSRSSQSSSSGGGGGSSSSRSSHSISSSGGGGGSSWTRTSHSSSSSSRSSSSQQVLPQNELKSYERRYEYNSNNRYGGFHPVENQG